MKRRGISLRRFLIIIIGLFCALTMYAVSYASPYKGSAHGGYVARPVYHSVGFVGVAQRPTATMGSTSSYAGSLGGGSANVNVPNVKVISTMASTVVGGQLADQTYAGIANVPGRRNIIPGNPDCHCHDDDGDEHCDGCGRDMHDECTCEEESGYCWCPIGDGWDVWLFMAVLGTGYAFVARRREELKAKSEELKS